MRAKKPKVDAHEPERPERSPLARAVMVEFFKAASDTTRLEGPFDGVRLEGRALLAVSGEERTVLATIDGHGYWVDADGVAWIDVSIAEDAAPVRQPETEA